MDISNIQMLRKQRPITVGVFSIIILRERILMPVMMIIIKQVIRALTLSHALGFLFGNLKIAILVITVQEQSKMELVIFICSV